MEQEIKNPFKTNFKLYIFILLLSIIFMILGINLQQQEEYSVIADIIKNLSYGSLASTLVALIIEISNNKDKNQRFNKLYKSIYFDLQFYIMKYIEAWSNICVIICKDKDYHQQKHKWVDWYKIIKSDLKKCTNKKKKEKMKFITSSIKQCIDNVNNSLNVISSQSNLLSLNDLYNDKLDTIIKDYEFEFKAAAMELGLEKTSEEFFKTFDAINKDITKYIKNWKDIEYYNNIKFKPYKIFENTGEIVRAIIETKNLHIKKDNKKKKQI